MRFKKSMLNLLASWLGQVLLVLVNLVVRRVFVDTLGEDYLGISGLFANVLSILSLAELGIGSAINYSLYRPIAENNYEEIKAIMKFYKMVYRVIGFTIIVAGIAIIPFLSIIVPEVKNYDNIYIYYGMFVLNTAISYFYSYKSTLIVANQNRYAYILNHYAWVCILGVVQVVCLYQTKNYVLYLVLQAAFTLFENISISKIADKMFPYLKEKTVSKMDRAIWTDIKKNTLAMMLDKIGWVLVTATDNIVMSRYFSLAITGIYSSYAYVVNCVGQILAQIFTAIQAGVGNLGVEEGVEARERIYKESFFAGYVFYSFGSICLSICLTPFIQIWMGDKYVMDQVTVFLIVFAFYLSGLRQVNLTFIRGLGLFWQTKWKAFLEGSVNLIVSIVLVKKIGISGVFIGTVISAIISGWFIEPYIVYRDGLKQSYKKFWVLNLKYLFSTVIFTGIAYYLQVTISFPKGFLSLMGQLLLCILIYALGMFLLWRKNEEFISLRTRVLMLLSKIKIKRR